jgi:hypothetical protein
VLNLAQKKHLAEIEKEWVNVGFARTEFTYDYTPKGIAEWDRLWARSLQLEKERNEILKEETP